MGDLMDVFCSLAYLVVVGQRHTLPPSLPHSIDDDGSANV